jgi:hypothetical protein
MSDRPPEDLVPEDDEQEDEDQEDYDLEEDGELEDAEGDDFLKSIIDKAHARQAGKRQRSTRDEVLELSIFVIDYAATYSPVTIRQLYYQASVKGLVEKTEAGYAKVQRRVLELRRPGARVSGRPHAAGGIGEAKGY